MTMMPPQAVTMSQPAAATPPKWFPEAIYGPKRPACATVKVTGAPSLAIVATRGAGAEVEGQVPNVVYYVVVWDTGEGKRWVTEHRYSEFSALRDSLLEVVPAEEHKSVKAMVFPKKKLFSYGKDTTDVRRVELETWLVKLAIGGVSRFRITPKPPGEGFPSETLVYSFLAGGTSEEPHGSPPAEGIPPEPAPAPAAPAPAPAPALAPTPAPAADEDSDDDAL
jgi:hypothetical protein